MKDTYLLQFKNSLWKYESFIDCEYIYIDIEDKIFKVIPKNVKSNMIQVLEYINKDKFIKDIKTNKLKWKNYDLPQTVLYYNQRGAGCGKTYESIQLLAGKEEFQEKTLFIYLTKIHSAKDVIYNEFKEQIKDNKIKPEEYIDNKNGNQYKIDLNINNRNLEIIIGTIDSYIYAIGDKSQKGMNYFNKLLKSIKNGYNEDIEKNGNIKYSKGKYKMNKECLIIIDEAQDLEIDYIEAIVEIMKNTYIDVYLIGDKLQSIWFSNNVYTYLENNELPNIKIIKNTGENVVRRFHNNQFIDFVNKIINFDNFKLPKISGCCDGICKYKHENNIKPYYIYQQPKIYPNDYDISKVNSYLKNIIKKISEKVDEYYYLPHNFMFIFPIMKNNYLSMLLQTSLNEYWMNKFLNKDYQDEVLINNEYWKDKIEDINNGKAFEFCFIHKSDGNKPINLNESKYSTKLLSIHSSKGLGCEVIFLLNLNQTALEILCKDDNEDKIIYNSLLHVAITRQKKFIYIGIDYDNDEDNIYKRFYNFIDEYYEKEKLDIRNNIKVDNIIQYINKENEKTLTKYINLDELIKKDINKEEIIDWGHHILRYYITEYELMINIYNDKNVDLNFKLQIKAIINKNINKHNIISLFKIEYYKKLKELYSHKNNKNNNEKAKELDEEIRNNIFLLKYDINDKTEYYNYDKILLSYIRDIQLKIEKSLLENDKLPHLCPIEILILLFIIKTSDKYFYSEITINDIYSMFILYNNSLSIKDKEIHNKEWNCFCHKHLNNNNCLTDNSLKNSIKNHYNIIKEVKNKYDYYKENININEDITYNINHSINFSGNTGDFKINFETCIIGNSNNNVILFLIQPQLSSLNICDIMIKNIIKKFIFNNQNKDKSGKNYERFYNKKINICIFTYTSNNPIIIRDDDLKIDDILIREIIKNSLYNIYEKVNKKISILFNYFIQEYKEKKKDDQFILFKKYLKKNNEKNIEYSSLTLDYIINTFEDIEKKPKTNPERIEFNKNSFEILNKNLKISLDNWIDIKDNDFDENEFI